MSNKLLNLLIFRSLHSTSSGTLSILVHILIGFLLLDIPQHISIKHKPNLSPISDLKCRQVSNIPLPSSHFLQHHQHRRQHRSAYRQEFRGCRCLRFVGFGSLL
jgi:hypothetical protein